MEPSSTTPQRRRSRIACTPCRQAKIKCGMRNPPCARCLRLKISCTVNPTFHRINKEDRIRQLEDHIQELRGLVGKKDETTSSTPASDLSITVAEALTSENQDLGLRDGLARNILANQESVQELPRPPSQNKYSIGLVTLSHEQADTLIAL